MHRDPGPDFPTADARSRRAGELFDELVELPAAERASRLLTIRAEDAALAREVEELLAADAEADGFLSSPLHSESPTLIGGESAAGAPAFSTGDRIGAWKMVRPLGAGGMGEVWEVERAEGDFTQRGALKLLKRGMDSEDMLRRFRAERQILARLHHPAIAHLYDGGLAPDGRPFYVMEVVAGQPLTDAAVAQKLSVDQRLGLFLTVCDAVEAAHRALVVHRDLKPSNVLVSDGGEVKLLDFGIAKVLAEDAEEGATRAWERVMTPAYAAPEQILGEPVTTSTDVYSLGVLLYELLTGRLPHERNLSSAARLAEGVTREVAERPSTAVQRVDEATPSRESLDATERERRARRLRGDLDWIMLRALAREPERRYASAAAFAADLRRHLEGRPVEARPDSFGYRTSRVVRRHKAAVAAAVLVLLALSAGTAVALWQARVARTQAARAEQESARARAEAERARREAVSSAKIADFLKTMILEANPTARSGSQTVTLLDAVRGGAANIEAELAGEPELQARMGIFFGDLFLSLDDLESARKMVERAYQVATTDPAVEPRTVVDAYGSLGQLRYMERNLDEAIRLHREGLRRVSQRLAAVPEDRPTRELEVTLRGLLALALYEGGQADAAMDELEKTLDTAQRVYGPVHREVAVVLANLGMLHMNAGRYAEAEPTLRRAYDVHLQLWGDKDARLFYVGTSLADVMLTRGELDAAFTMYQRAHAAAVAGFGEDSPLVTSALVSLGEARLAQGRLDEASAYLLDGLRRADGQQDDRSGARADRDLALVAEARGRHPEAVTHWASGGRKAARHYSADHTNALDFIVHELAARAQAGATAALAVVPRLEQLVAQQREKADDPADVVFALHALGDALVLAGREAEGIARLREAVVLGDSGAAGSSRLITEKARLALGVRLAAAADGASHAEGRRLMTTAVSDLEKVGRGWMPEVQRAKALLAGS